MKINTKMITLFLINPYSAKIKKKGFEKIADLISKSYDSAGEAVVIRKLDFDKLDEWVAQAASENITRIFAVGGDGTANAVAVKLIGTKLGFGVIPMGSGNGFARTLGFSTHFRLAIKQSIKPHCILADTGFFENHQFINVAGVGADTEVVALFRFSKRRGILPYIYYATKVFFSYPILEVELYADGKKISIDKPWSVTVMNGTQWGYDAKISPEASLTDGELELIIMKKIPIWHIFQQIFMLFNSTVQYSAYLKIIPCSEVIIKRKQAGAAQIDGEYIEAGETIKAGVREKSLYLLLPSTLTPDKKASI